MYLFGCITTVLFLLSGCCYGDIIIERNKVQNSLNFTDSFTNETNVKCPTNHYALLDSSDGTPTIKCFGEKQILDNSTQGCEFQSSVPLVCKTKPDNPISVRQFGQSKWSLFKTDCLKLKNTTGIVENDCDDLAGWLIRVEFRCSTNDTSCVIFTFPGTVNQDLVATNDTKTTTSKPLVTFNTTASTFNNKTTLTTTTTAPINATTLTTQNNNNNNTFTTSTTTTTTTSNNSTDNSTIIIITTQLPSLSTTQTTINGGNNINDDDDDDKNLMYIIIIVCVVLLILLVAFCLCLRKRIWKRHRGSLPLLEINPGKDINEDNIEEIYAVPKKKKKKQKKTNKDDPLNPPTIWPNYDEVGQVIEGTYEQRESANLDANNKYGVSAMLFQDSAVDHSPILSLSPNSSYLHNGGGGNVDEDPYEKLGRCNSFTPKTRAEKTKEMIELKEKGLQEDEKETGDEVDNKVLPTNKKTDDDIIIKDKNTKDVVGTEDVTAATDLPFVGGKNIKPMEMGSFKPGASMRKKQQRTSMKKPNKGASGENKPSETHEEVKITPLPLKKDFALNNAQRHTPNGDGGGSAFSSCEKIPDALDDGKQSLPSDMNIGDDKRPSENVIEAKIGSKDQIDSVDHDTDFSKKTEPNYADIEIIKQNGEGEKEQNGESLNHPPNGDVKNGNYTDVIIADN